MDVVEEDVSGDKVEAGSMEKVVHNVEVPVGDDVDNVCVPRGVDSLPVCNDADDKQSCFLLVPAVLAIQTTIR